MKPKPPCKDCFDRKLNCHSMCEKFAIWKNKMEEINSQIRKEKDAIFTSGYRKVLDKRVRK